MLQHIAVFFAKNPTNTDLLSEFIKKLDDLLAEEAVEIINGPTSPIAKLYNITASTSSVERQLTRDEVLDLFRDIKEDELKEGIKLHVMDTDKFKTNLIAIFLTTKLDRNDVTKNALISAINSNCTPSIALSIVKKSLFHSLAVIQ